MNLNEAVRRENDQLIKIMKLNEVTVCVSAVLSLFQQFYSKTTAVDVQSTDLHRNNVD
jgi:hypothetical protein